MFDRRIKLFKLFGFSIRIDISWLIIALLVTWSLARGLFPFYYKNLSDVTYWWMGIAGAVGLFVSIVAHELSHSLIARRFDFPITGITLFIFGGVAEMEDEPPSAKAEFFMAIAGPIASVLIGTLGFGIALLGIQWHWPVYVVGVLWYLGWINWVLVLFNMIPAFPLDGGRVLRSALWQWKKDIQWATRIASQLGTAFGIFLTLVGIGFIFSGGVISGLWWILLGIFLSNASRLSYQKVALNEALKGESISRFMIPQVVTVPSALTLEDLVEKYIYHHHYKMYPVVDNDTLKGYITTRELKNVPRNQWNQSTVADQMIPIAETETIPPTTDALQALAIMRRRESGRLMVVEKGKLVGVLTLKDLLAFLALKLDLENG